MVTGCDRQRVTAFSRNRHTVGTHKFYPFGVLKTICGPLPSPITTRGPPESGRSAEVLLARPNPSKDEALLTVSPIQSKIQYALVTLGSTQQ